MAQEIKTPELQIKQNEAIATKWFDAFNTKNLEMLLSLYANDAKHYSPKLKIRKPETNGWIRGKNELRLWWSDAFERLPNLRYEPQTFTTNNDRIFMEYIRKVAGEDDMLVGEVLEFKNEKIIASRVYHG
jgi:hypothetical protein